MRAVAEGPGERESGRGGRERERGRAFSPRVRLSYPQPRQCSLPGDLSRPGHCDLGSPTSPASTAHVWGERAPAARLPQLPASK
ncbi:unnamed protein product [Rangifer tarandus platyrhynchus]|uniref:Uncharacterized protein n=1 Tax=Rangifer tarandus platyrhynchus TaxID=3082113 RepID=A0AC59YPD3_RANTA